MESAAATAFDRLARELADHGAPAALVTAAWQAADDEKHHARLMGTVAEEFGETAVFYDAAPLPLRPLLAVALENAREGVVHETFGAVLNAHQSEHAESARLRACYAAIAEDELAHARLSLEVHAWALTRLNSSERAQVISEVTSAVAAVGAQVATTRDRDPRFGLPAREATREILASLSEKVWSTCV